MVQQKYHRPGFLLVIKNINIELCFNTHYGLKSVRENNPKEIFNTITKRMSYLILGRLYNDLVLESNYLLSN